MIYKAELKNGESLTFSVYNYHYQDVDLKYQFDTDFINIIALYEKAENEYRLINIDLVNLRDYFITKLPTNDLYRANKVLLLGGIRPPSIEETNIYLTDLLQRIKESIPQTIFLQNSNLNRKMSLILNNISISQEKYWC